MMQDNTEILQVQSDPLPEEISLSSSDETTTENKTSDDTLLAKKNNENSTSWEMRESIEITLTAQPEDTVTGAEERFDMAEVSFTALSLAYKLFESCYLLE